MTRDHTGYKIEYECSVRVGDDDVPVLLLLEWQSHEAWYLEHWIVNLDEADWPSRDPAWLNNVEAAVKAKADTLPDVEEFFDE